MTDRTKEKPKSALDLDCKACGMPKGVQCRRRPKGLHFKASMETPCFVRSREYMRAHGLGRRYRKGAPNFRTEKAPPSEN